MLSATIRLNYVYTDLPNRSLCQTEQLNYNGTLTVCIALNELCYPQTKAFLEF